MKEALLDVLAWIANFFFFYVLLCIFFGWEWNNVYGFVSTILSLFFTQFEDIRSEIAYMHKDMKK